MIIEKCVAAERHAIETGIAFETMVDNGIKVCFG